MRARVRSVTLPVELAGLPPTCFAWYVVGARASTLHNPKTSKRQQSRSCHCSVIFFCDFPLFLSFFKEKDKMAEEYDGKQKVKSMLAGGFGGICVVLSGHPFDTVKVSFFPIL